MTDTPRTPEQLRADQQSMVRALAELYRKSWREHDFLVVQTVAATALDMLSSILTMGEFTLSYLGACPFCGWCDGYVQAGDNYWFLCQRHQVRWSVEPARFAQCWDGNEQPLITSAKRVSSYLVVTPVIVLLRWPDKYQQKDVVKE